MRKKYIFFALFLTITYDTDLIGSFDKSSRQGFCQFFSDGLDGLLRVINLNDMQMGWLHIDTPCLGSCPQTIYGIREIILGARLEDEQVRAVLDKLQEIRRVLDRNPLDNGEACKFLYYSKYPDDKVKAVTRRVYDKMQHDMAWRHFLERRR